MSVSCKPCGARWTGLRMEHCTVCHRTFSGSTTGDQHRPVGGPCLTDEQMHEKGFRLTDPKSRMWRKAPAENPHWNLASRPDGEAGPAHADPLRAPAPSPDGGAS